MPARLCVQSAGCMCRDAQIAALPSPHTGTSYWAQAVAYGAFLTPSLTQCPVRAWRLCSVAASSLQPAAWPWWCCVCHLALHVLGARCQCLRLHAVHVTLNFKSSHHVGGQSMVSGGAGQWPLQATTACAAEMGSLCSVHKVAPLHPPAGIPPTLAQLFIVWPYATPAYGMIGWRLGIFAPLWALLHVSVGWSIPAFWWFR